MVRTQSFINGEWLKYSRLEGEKPPLTCGRLKGYCFVPFTATGPLPIQLQQAYPDLDTDLTFPKYPKANLDTILTFLKYPKANLDTSLTCQIY
jgi:hypothetical protein